MAIYNVSIEAGQPVATQGYITPIAASAVSVELLAANEDRKGATVYNDSTAKLCLSLCEQNELSLFTIRLRAGMYYEVPFWYSGPIFGLWTEAEGQALITEVV